VPAVHEVRAIAAFVDKLDLRGSTPTFAPAARSPAHPPPCPKILLGLWVYATRDGVGSGREIVDPGLVRPLTGDDDLGVVMPMRIQHQVVEETPPAHPGLVTSGVRPTSLRSLLRNWEEIATVIEDLGRKGLPNQLKLTDIDMMSSGLVRSQPTRTSLHDVFRRQPPTKRCGARSQPTRGRLLLDVALRSRAAPRTVPKR
jgi:hypothetical protein